MSLLSLLVRSSVRRSIRPRYFRPIRPSYFHGTRAFIERLPTRRHFVLPSRFIQGGRYASAISSVLPGRRRRMGSETALPRPVSFKSSYFSDFRPLGDMRTFHPMGVDRPPFVLSRAAARWVYPPGPSGPVFVPPGGGPMGPMTSRPIIVRGSPESKLGFDKPSRVVICLKRYARRQIMHALGVAGLRGLGRPHMKWHSFVRC